MALYDDVIAALLAFPWLLVSVILVGAWVEWYVGRRRAKSGPTPSAQRCGGRIAHAPAAAGASQAVWREDSMCLTGRAQDAYWRERVAHACQDTPRRRTYDTAAA